MTKIGSSANQTLSFQSALAIAAIIGLCASAFVYVTYIRTTPEKLWLALTDEFSFAFAHLDA